MDKKNLILLIGASGSGKTALANILSEMYECRVVNSYTTRPKRYADEKGHTFINSFEFSKLKDLCAYAVFDGYEYGATKEQVDNSDIYIINPKGAVKFIKTYTEEMNGKTPLRVIILDAEKDTRLCRMIARGDSMEKATQRIANDNIEFSQDNIDKVEKICYNKNIPCFHLDGDDDLLVNANVILHYIKGKGII